MTTKFLAGRPARALSGHRAAAAAPCGTLLCVGTATPALAAARPLHAFAHTELRESTPARNAQVAAPAEVRLVFTEPVRSSLARVQVRDAAGGRHESGPARVTAVTVLQGVSAGIPAGRYIVAYRVVADDGHPVEGTVPFSVTGSGTGSGTGTGSKGGRAAPEPPRTSTADAGSGTERWLMVGAGLTVGAGIGFGIVWLRRRRDTASPDRD